MAQQVPQVIMGAEGASWLGHWLRNSTFITSVAGERVHHGWGTGSGILTFITSVANTALMRDGRFAYSIPRSALLQGCCDVISAAQGEQYL